MHKNIRSMYLRDQKEILDPLEMDIRWFEPLLWPLLKGQPGCSPLNQRVLNLKILTDIVGWRPSSMGLKRLYIVDSVALANDRLLQNKKLLTTPN